MDVRDVTDLAVLVDAENVPARFADRLFEHVATLGCASVRRAYGDFSGLWSAAWASACARHAIVSQQQFSAGAGKNSADIALVVDAMELLAESRVDAICLASSDGDFSPLALKLRERGMALYGFGGADTPERFRQACKRFTYLENLAPNAAASLPVDVRILKPIANVTGLLRRAFVHAKSQEGWASLSDIEQLLPRLRADFDPRTYGQRNLLALVQRTKVFAVDMQHDNGPRVRLKRKTAIRQP
ncbi:NYN domain-containing protein [Mesorhizobium muleiense]|uniref:NYN domain-containing protein n=1 Tax=Mesorhizobium muleiense TaxID=1004279 RepID=UPI003AFA8AFD